MTGLRLYENLGMIADALPPAMRRDVLVIMRRPAWRLPDTPAHRAVRVRVRRALPARLRPVLTLALAMATDDGGWDTLRRWATDAGHVSRSST